MTPQHIETLIHDMLLRQNKLVVGHLMPALESAQDRLARMERENEVRIRQLESACADLAAEVYKLKTGRNIQDDVRKH